MSKQIFAPQAADSSFNRRSISALIVLVFVFLHSVPFAAAEIRSDRPFPAAAMPAAPLVSTSVVISQVYGGGGNAGATLKNDYIELHNRGTAAVSLNGWSVQYASSAGTTWATTPLSNFSLQPGQYYLVQEAAGTSTTAVNLPTPDAIGTIAMSATAGKVLVANTTTAATGATGTFTSGTRIDAVAYGTASTMLEGTQAPGLSNTTLAYRAMGGCTDTDNNGSDLTAVPAAPATTAATMPHNTASTAVACDGSAPTNPSGSGSANPNPVTAGLSVLLQIAVTSGTNPAGGGESVTVDLTSIGGAADQVFYDDSTNGDTAAGDKIFSFNYTVPSATSGGAKTLPATITDGQDRIGTASISLTVTSNATALTLTGNAAPSTVVPGDPTLLTATVTPGTNPASSSITVAGNLSAFGGPAAQAFYDDGTNGDQTANDNIFSYLYTIPATATGGGRTVRVTATDAQSRTATANITITVNGPVDQNEHLTLGNPSGAVTDINQPNNYLLAKPQYAVGYSRDQGKPNWVSWHLDASWTTGAAARQNDFRPDDTLPAEWYHVSMSDYSGSGFDRGHNCPSADRTSSVPDNSATFLMTNMMPQAPDNNQGTWETLESFSRTLIGQGNELYIIAGSTGQGGTGSNGFANTVANGRVVVPKYTWKVVVVLPTGDSDASRVTANTRVFAVIMPNIQGVRSDPWQKYLVSVRQVEALTGYNFLSNVAPAVQNTVESRIDQASNTSPQTLAGGTFTDLALTTNVTLTGDVTVNGALTLGAEILQTGNNRLILGPNATVTRNGGYVAGNLVRQFSAPTANAVFPVGTVSNFDPAANYSPVTVNVTAVGAANSQLTVKATAGVEPNVTAPNQALKRYWTLTEAGDLTADLTFQYLDADVPVGINESNFQLYKYETAAPTVVPATIDPAANTAATAGISQFSDWTLVSSLAPTAAGAGVGGRVFSSQNRGLNGAVVTLTDARGQKRTARTNAFGYFGFADVPAGQTYLVNVAAKSYRFAPQTINVTENLSDLRLTAQP